VTPLLLDASVWLATSDRGDRYHAAAGSLVRAAAEGAGALAALDSTLYEIANVAVMRWRSRRDAERLVALVYALCPDTLERADERLVAEASALAFEHGITVYDGAYVAVARRRGWSFVSADLVDLVRTGLAIAPDAAISAL
jgi:predicted nucleic acid-binding protein